MKKQMAALMVAAMTMGLVAGCGSSETASTDEKTPDTQSQESGTTDTADDGLITVGYAQVGHESDWRTANTQNYQDTFCKDNGYSLEFVDCDNDNAKQIEAVRTFISEGLDYIVVAPIETAGWDTVLQEAKDNGIPVIIADREIDADASSYTAWVGTNTKNEGITAGNWLDSYLKGEAANILVIEGSTGASATLGRTEGFNSVADTKDNWKILDSQSGDFTQDGGQEVMESYIKSYEGQFNVVVCQNDNEAYGAMDAMDAAGITYGVGGDVTIISFDATHDGLQYTLDGKINCDVECNPIQAEVVGDVIQAIQNNESYEATTLVDDEAFVAPGCEWDGANTMTQEILDGRKY